MERLTEWVLNQGGKLSGVKVGETKLGRGLVATRDIKKGTTVISTPLSQCPSPMMLDNSPLKGLDTFIQNDLGYADDYVLSLLVEFETNGNTAKAKAQAEAAGTTTNAGDLHPYVSMLPIPPLPSLFDNPQTYQHLDGTYSGTQVTKVRKSIKSSFDKIFVNGLFRAREGEPYHDLFDPNKTTLRTWSESLAKVWSRSYNLYKDGRMRSDELTWAMVPLADLVNHDIDAENNYIQDFGAEPMAFNLRLSKDVKQGDELFITYGMHTSLQYFLFYGFVLPQNPVDFFTLRLLVPEQQQQGQEPQQQQQEEEGGNTKKTNTKAKSSPSLKEVFHTEVDAKGDVPLEFLIKIAKLKFGELALSEGIKKAAQLLIPTIQRQIDSQRTTLEEDVKLLQDISSDPSGIAKQYPSSMTTMLQLTINHKTVLHNTVRELGKISENGVPESEVKRFEVFRIDANKGQASLSQYGMPIDDIDCILK